MIIFFDIKLRMEVLIMLWRVYHLEIIWENLQHTEFSGQVALSSHILWR